MEEECEEEGEVLGSQDTWSAKDVSAEDKDYDPNRKEISDGGCINVVDNDAEAYDEVLDLDDDEDDESISVTEDPIAKLQKHMERTSVTDEGMEIDASGNNNSSVQNNASQSV